MRFTPLRDSDTAVPAGEAGAAGAASAGGSGSKQDDDIWPAPTESDFKDENSSKPPPATAFAPVSVS